MLKEKDYNNENLEKFGEHKEEIGAALEYSIWEDYGAEGVEHFCHEKKSLLKRSSIHF